MQNDTLQPSDAEIIRRIAAGNVNAFEFLLKKYQALVLKIVARRLPAHEVEETAQEVFVRAYRSLPSFKGTADFSHWLSAVAVRTCYDYWRKTYRLKEISISALSDQQQQWIENAVYAQSGDQPAPEGYRSQVGEVLDWALAKLSAEDRMVIELVYFESLSVKAAAELLGWSGANVKVRLFTNRQLLKSLLIG